MPSDIERASTTNVPIAAESKESLEVKKMKGEKSTLFVGKSKATGQKKRFKKKRIADIESAISEVSDSDQKHLDSPSRTPATTHRVSPIDPSQGSSSFFKAAVFYDFKKPFIFYSIVLSVLGLFFSIAMLFKADFALELVSILTSLPPLLPLAIFLPGFLTAIVTSAYLLKRYTTSRLIKSELFVSVAIFPIAFVLFFIPGIHISVYAMFAYGGATFLFSFFCIFVACQEIEGKKMFEKAPAWCTLSTLLWVGSPVVFFLPGVNLSLLAMSLISAGACFVSTLSIWRAVTVTGRVSLPRHYFNTALLQDPIINPASEDKVNLFQVANLTVDLETNEQPQASQILQDDIFKANKPVSPHVTSSLNQNLSMPDRDNFYREQILGEQGEGIVLSESLLQSLIQTRKIEAKKQAQKEKKAEKAFKAEASKRTQMLVKQKQDWEAYRKFTQELKRFENLLAIYPNSRFKKEFENEKKVIEEKLSALSKELELDALGAPVTALLFVGEEKEEVTGIPESCIERIEKEACIEKILKAEAKQILLLVENVRQKINEIGMKIEKNRAQGLIPVDSGKKVIVAPAILPSKSLISSPEQDAQSEQNLLSLLRKLQSNYISEAIRDPSTAIPSLMERQDYLQVWVQYLEALLTKCQGLPKTLDVEGKKDFAFDNIEACIAQSMAFQTHRQEIEAELQHAERRHENICAAAIDMVKIQKIYNQLSEKCCFVTQILEFIHTKKDSTFFLQFDPSLNIDFTQLGLEEEDLSKARKLFGGEVTRLSIASLEQEVRKVIVTREQAQVQIRRLYPEGVSVSDINAEEKTPLAASSLEFTAGRKTRTNLNDQAILEEELKKLKAEKDNFIRDKAYVPFVEQYDVLLKMLEDIQLNHNLPICWELYGLLNTTLTPLVDLDGLKSSIQMYRTVYPGGENIFADMLSQIDALIGIEKSIGEKISQISKPTSPGIYQKRLLEGSKRLKKAKENFVVQRERVFFIYQCRTVEKALTYISSEGRKILQFPHAANINKSNWFTPAFLKILEECKVKHSEMQSSQEFVVTTRASTNYDLLAQKVEGYIQNNNVTDITLRRWALELKKISVCQKLFSAINLQKGINLNVLQYNLNEYFKITRSLNETVINAEEKKQWFLDLQNLCKIAGISGETGANVSEASLTQEMSLLLGITLPGHHEEKHLSSEKEYIDEVQAAFESLQQAAIQISNERYELPLPEGLEGVVSIPAISNIYTTLSEIKVVQPILSPDQKLEREACLIFNALKESVCSLIDLTDFKESAALSTFQSEYKRQFRADGGKSQTEVIAVFFSQGMSHHKNHELQTFIEKNRREWEKVFLSVQRRYRYVFESMNGIQNNPILEGFMDGLAAALFVEGKDLELFKEQTQALLHDKEKNLFQRYYQGDETALINAIYELLIKADPICNEPAEVNTTVQGYLKRSIQHYLNDWKKGFKDAKEIQRKNLASNLEEVLLDTQGPCGAFLSEDFMTQCGLRVKDLPGSSIRKTLIAELLHNTPNTLCKNEKINFLYENIVLAMTGFKKPDSIEVKGSSDKEKILKQAMAEVLSGKTKGDVFSNEIDGELGSSMKLEQQVLQGEKHAQARAKAKEIKKRKRDEEKQKRRTMHRDALYQALFNGDPTEDLPAGELIRQFGLKEVTEQQAKEWIEVAMQRTREAFQKNRAEGQNLNKREATNILYEALCEMIQNNSAAKKVVVFEAARIIQRIAKRKIQEVLEQKQVIHHSTANAAQCDATVSPGPKIQEMKEADLPLMQSIHIPGFTLEVNQAATPDPYVSWLKELTDKTLKAYLVQSIFSSLTTTKAEAKADLKADSKKAVPDDFQEALLAGITMGTQKECKNLFEYAEEIRESLVWKKEDTRKLIANVMSSRLASALQQAFDWSEDMCPILQKLIEKTVFEFLKSRKFKEIADINALNIQNITQTIHKILNDTLFFPSLIAKLNMAISKQVIQVEVSQENLTGHKVPKNDSHYQSVFKKLTALYLPEKTSSVTHEGKEDAPVRRADNLAYTIGSDVLGRVLKDCFKEEQPGQAQNAGKHGKFKVFPPFQLLSLNQDIVKELNACSKWHLKLLPKNELNKSFTIKELAAQQMAIEGALRSSIKLRQEMIGVEVLFQQEVREAGAGSVSLSSAP